MRHSFLKTALVCAALVGMYLVAAIGAGQSNARSPDRSQLNLIFHGLFSFVIWPDRIEVLAAQVDDHVYKAGSWGKELRLREGAAYRLTGVTGGAGPPSIDRRNNLVLTHVANIDRSPDKVFCSFTLPQPAQIVGLRRARINKARPPFSGTAAAPLSFDSLPLVQTLVYPVADIAKLSLGNSFAWSPEITAAGTVNLHLWAEPDSDFATANHAHSPAAFARMMSMFPGVDLHLEFDSAAEPDPKVNVRGINVWEQRTLLERSALLFPARRAVGKGAEVSNCIGVLIDNTVP